MEITIPNQFLVNKSIKVLDLGCGTSELTKKLSNVENVIGLLSLELKLQKRKENNLLMKRIGANQLRATEIPMLTF